jgi:hypothetical protein
MCTSSNVKFTSEVSKPYTLVYIQVVRRCGEKSKTLNVGTQKP